MKKILILMALCAFIASCNQNKGSKTLERENDSLRKEIVAQKRHIVVSVADTSLTDSTTADAEILRMQRSLDSGHMDTSVGFIVSRAVIDSAFAYTDSMATRAKHDSACGLIFYVGLYQTHLHLYWQPVYLNPAGSSKKYHTQYIYRQDTGGVTRLVFDHTLPCPECGIQGAPGHIFE